MGPSENVYLDPGPPPFFRYQKHVADTNRNSEGHHLDSAGPSLEETAGHIFHEHHTRYPGYTASKDQNDDKDRPDYVWMACAALADASRTLKPFDVASAIDYFDQAMNTRTYLYDLSTKYSKPPDYYVPWRAQAMLDFMINDYSQDGSIMSAARQKLALDLIKFWPTTSDNVGPWWTLGGLVKNSYSGPSAQSKTVDPPAYSAIDPLLYCVENSVPDWPQMPQPHETWQQALTDIHTYWYQSKLSGTSFANPLRIGWIWNLDTPPTEFFGEEAFLDKQFAIDCYATAELAPFFGRGSLQYGQLLRLSYGNLGWLLGMNMGVLSRHVQAAGGGTDTDLAHAGASLVNAIGSHWAMQVIDGEHQWSQPTVVSGISGQPKFTGTSITNWNAAPFSYSRSEYLTSESFIKNDGILLMALEQLGRDLHPFLTVEAEDFTLAALVTNAHVEPNNYHVTGGVWDFLNGGSSMVGLSSNDSLAYSALLPPEPYSAMLGNTYHYRTRLRASNMGSSTTVTLVITQGTNSWTRTFPVTTTTDVHDYGIVDDGTGFSLPLLSGMTFSFTCTIGNPGPCAIDDVVFESDGNGV